MIETALTTQIPVNGYLTDSAYSLGTLIRVARAGNVLGMRWYFPLSGLTFPVQMRLYRYDSESAGTLLASGQFTDGLYATWNNIEFDEPVHVTAGTILQVVVNSNPYVSTAGLLTSASITNGNLTILQDLPAVPRRNGRYLQGSTITYPQTSAVDGHCFFTDILFEADVTSTPGDPPPPDPGLFHPTSDMVAVAWLRQLPYIEAGVATELPRNTASWAENGFIQVSTVGGTPDMYLPVRQPAVSVDCWAVPASASGKPPWNKANQLAEQVRAACYFQDSINNLLVTLPDTYNDARVIDAYLLTEPRRVFDDEGSYARYQFDLQLMWTERGPE